MLRGADIFICYFKLCFGLYTRSELTKLSSFYLKNKFELTISIFILQPVKIALLYWQHFQAYLSFIAIKIYD